MISLKDMALLKEDNQFCDCCLTIASVRNLGDVSFIIREGMKKTDCNEI